MRIEAAREARRVGNMHDELQAFLEAPSARTYRRVREALLDEVASASAEALSLTALVELAELAAAGEFASAIVAVIRAAPVPAWALHKRGLSTHPLPRPPAGS